MKVLPVLALLVFTGCAAVGAAEQKKVPDDLWQKMQKERTVRVIVSLNVPVQPETNLKQDAVNSQRQRIAEAQKELLKELAETKHVLLGETHTVPSVGLNVGADALAILERSSMVLNVSESKYIPPQNLGLREIKP